MDRPRVPLGGPNVGGTNQHPSWGLPPVMGCNVKRNTRLRIGCAATRSAVQAVSKEMSTLGAVPARQADVESELGFDVAECPAPIDRLRCPDCPADGSGHGIGDVVARTGGMIDTVSPTSRGASLQCA